MTVSPIYTVWCDGPDLGLCAPSSITCHHWCEATADTHTDAARNAKAHGWRTRAIDNNIRHLCPPCDTRYLATLPPEHNPDRKDRHRKPAREPSAMQNGDAPRQR